MIPIHEITPQLRALFEIDLPAGVRCQAVLNGDFAGTIYTDDPHHPTWGVVHETVYGTFYPVGQMTAPLLLEWVRHFQTLGETLVGLWPDDPLFALMPSGVVYDGWVFDYTERQGSLEAYLTAIPEGCAVRRVDADTFPRSADYEAHVRFYGSPEKALEKISGFLVLWGDAVVCEALATQLRPKIMEVGVATADDFRGRGCATVACAHLIQACEQAGFETYWNCNAQNLASVALARKLGYQREQAYRLLAWEAMIEGMEG